MEAETPARPGRGRDEPAAAVGAARGHRGAAADGGPGTRPERACDGLRHLQAAARELIQAARALLDVAEELVDDPAAIAAVARAALTLCDAARRPRTAAANTGDRPGEGSGAARGGEGRIQRITVA
jgi:hypothetical protein